MRVEGRSYYFAASRLARSLLKHLRLNQPRVARRDPAQTTRAIPRVSGPVMKLVSSVVAVAILSAILPTQAQDRSRRAPSAVAPLATTDPLKPIYRVSGVTNNGVANSGVATLFHCTSFSQVTETIRFVVRDFEGSKVGDQSVSVPSLFTRTAATHETNLFAEDKILTPGEPIFQGSAQISSTSLQVHCSAMIVDAASNGPQGIALHMVRLNPAGNTQE